MSPSSFRAVLAERASRVGVALQGSELDSLEMYWELLKRWNQKINLTALPLKDCPLATIDRLFIEPLTAAAVVSNSRLDWFDLGSGGGSPAIPLKVRRPGARLTMVESRSKKASFLQEVIRGLGMAEAVVATARIEDLGAGTDGQPAADLISVRAVKLGPPVARSIARLLSAKGHLLVFSSSALPELPTALFKEVSRLALPSGSLLYVFTRSGVGGMG